MSKIDELLEGFIDAVMPVFRFIHEGIQEVFIPALEQISRFFTRPTFREDDGRNTPSKGENHEQ